MIKKEVANKFLEYLKELYYDGTSELFFNNNYQLLVAVILSAQCTDKRVNLVTPILFDKYKTVYDLAKANNDDIEKIIYSCGFYRAKAKSLIESSTDIVNKFNGIVPNNLKDLTTLRGVGQKTANVVLAVGYNIPAFAVDTHVFRVGNRLGLTKSNNPKESEKQLTELYDKSLWINLHYQMVLFGRYVCKAQNPNCRDCKMKNECLYFKSTKK